MPDQVARLLVGGTWTETPKSFRIIALSRIADACASQAAVHAEPALRCVSRVLALAQDLRPRRYDPHRPDDWGLYASHLNLILGAQDKVGGPHDTALHDRISRALAARTAREPTHHVPSFAGTDHRWPADQSVTLASLVRFDDAHGAQLAGPAVKAWRNWLDRHSQDGLPWSEATGRARHAKLPRGCAMSYMIRFTSEVDLALARQWWARYKKSFYVDRVIMVGFREWPPGQDLPADVDSGPIVSGVGAAATALGLTAARAVGDGAAATRLAATASMIGSAAGLSGRLAAARNSTLAQAILFEAKNQAALSPRASQPPIRSTKQPP